MSRESVFDSRRMRKEVSFGSVSNVVSSAAAPCQGRVGTHVEGKSEVEGWRGLYLW